MLFLIYNGYVSQGYSVFRLIKDLSPQYVPNMAMSIANTKSHDALWCTSPVLCCLSDAGNQDRVVIQELIKTVAQSQQIQSSTQREFKGQKLTSQAFRGQGTPEQGLECTKTDNELFTD